MSVQTNNQQFSQLSKRVQSYGLSRKDSAIAIQVVVKAIRSLLIEGEIVVLPFTGVFRFVYRKGRVMPNNKMKKGPIVQRESYAVKWRSSKAFKDELKGVKPKSVLKLATKPKYLIASQSAGPEDSHPPSSLPDKVP